MKTVSVSKYISIFCLHTFLYPLKIPFEKEWCYATTLQVRGKKGQATKAGFVPQSILNTYQPHLDASQIHHSINTDTPQTRYQ